MTGFGSTVIALTLGAHLLPIPELLPVLVALNLPLTVHVSWRERDHIDRALLVRGILPLMSVGVGLGLIAAPFVEGPGLRRAFGVFVVAVALRQLWGVLRDRPPEGAGPWRTRALLVASGLTHGVWASGGPLLVLALGGLRLDRRAFRATLMTVWLVFNLLLLVSQAARGVWTADALFRTAVLLPVLPVGIALGDALHHRVPERTFRGAVQVVLLVAGAALI